MSATRPFKYVFVGDPSVGKTALVETFSQGNFVQGHLPTIGVDYVPTSLKIENEEIKLQLWDTSSQPKFQGIVRTYYPKADVVFLVYDTTNAASLANIKKWLEEVKKYEPNACFVLVGTKSNLPQNVTAEQVQAKAEELEIDPSLCFQVSAETGSGLKDMFTAVTKKTYLGLPEEEKKPRAQTTSPVRLLIMPRKSYFQRNREKVAAGAITAILLTILAVTLGIVFWPAIAALVPVAVGVTVGAALGIPALTAATALAATGFAVITAGIVSFLSFLVGKFSFKEKKDPLLALDETLATSLGGADSVHALEDSKIEQAKVKVLYGSTGVIRDGLDKNHPAPAQAAAAVAPPIVISPAPQPQPQAQPPMPEKPLVRTFFRMEEFAVPPSPDKPKHRRETSENWDFHLSLGHSSESASM